MDYLLFPVFLFLAVLVYLVYRQRKLESSIDVRFEESNRKIEDLQQNIQQGIENAVESVLSKSSNHLNRAYTSMGKTLHAFNEMKSYFTTISGLEVEE